jgi:hypothetical protein
MVSLPEVLVPVDPNRYPADNKTMEDNFRKAKRQAVGFADGIKNPSHCEYLSEAVYTSAKVE